MRALKAIGTGRVKASAWRIITLALGAALAATVCAGCKTAQQPGTGFKSEPRPRTSVERRLSSLMGADISAAVGILGFPDEKREGAGMEIYVWTDGKSSRRAMTEIRMGSYADGQAEPSGMGSPCRIELSADDHGRVAGYQWSGTEGHCSWVTQAFSRADHEEQSREQEAQSH